MMHNKPVSIMIPTYNASATITETLKSVLAQSYTNMEVIVVDNASTDNTIDLIKQLNDPRLKVMINEKNIGAEGNFNKCIELAQGDYIAIYHADDIYNSSIIAREAEFLDNHPETGAVFTMGNIINEMGQVIPNRFFLPKTLLQASGIYNLKEILPHLLKYGNHFLICPTAMVKKDVFKNEVQRWRQDLFGTASDVDVWLRILENHPIGIINEPLISYRHSTTHWSAQYNKMRTSRSDGLSVYDHYIGRHGNLLSQDDLDNYRFYEMIDNLKRGIHYILMGDKQNAISLLSPILDKIIVRKGFSSLFNLKVFFAGILLYLSIKTGIGYELLAKKLKEFY